MSSRLLVRLSITELWKTLRVRAQAIKLNCRRFEPRTSHIHSHKKLHIIGLHEDKQMVNIEIIRVICMSVSSSS